MFQNDPELVSCYYSASHTDNLSTDEHDSVRDSHVSSNRSAIIKSLQSSDSGADLSEYIKSDLESAWQKYWTVQGERIIWDSWIAKYRGYINPDYIQQCGDVPEDEPDRNEIDKTDVPKKIETKTRFSFDKKEVEKFSDVISEPNLSRIDEDKLLEKPDKVQRNHFLIRDLSGSDSYEKLNGEISEGWNPLSPLSIDCEIEAERLLSSRCGSHASSSLRTVDSLTNVTRMTVSSIDLSESSKTSDSISSVSSVQSSLSSTSSEENCDNFEYEQEWNNLWKSHYEEIYLENYKKFITSQVDCSCLAADLYEGKEIINLLPN